MARLAAWHTPGTEVRSGALGKGLLPGPLGPQGHAGLTAAPLSQELTLQMNLLELIRKLQQRGCAAGKAAL